MSMFENEDPCDSENAILLPSLKTCLVYNNRAKTWIEAAQECERSGGSLYRLEDGRLQMEKNVRDCLGSHPQGATDMAFWIGAIGTWTPQWYWVNGSYLSPLDTCAVNTTGLTSPNSRDICSKYLSIDHCVATCRSDGAKYSVVTNQQTFPCCWCSNRSPEYPKVCSSERVTFGQTAQRPIWVYNTFSQTDLGIILDSSEIFTTSETLCGVIDDKTAVRRELSSEPCFTKNPFICDLGTAYRPCQLLINDHCMYIGEDKLNWAEARAVCRVMGGDLVLTVKDIDVINQFKPLIKGSHWVGATNYYWNFEPLSNVFGGSPDYESIACGHMHNDQANGDWDWSDAKCDTTKPFVCQYRPKTNVASVSSPFVCPWPIRVGRITNGPFVDITTGPPIGILPNDTAVSYVGSGGSTFPLAAIIAASIMALLILTCAILTIGFSRRRKRFVSNMRKSFKSDGFWAISKAPRHYFQLWNTPYSVYSDRKSDIDVDSLSTIHTGVFNEGSVSGYGYGYDEHGRPVYMMDGGDYIYGKINRTHSERSNIQPHVLRDPIQEVDENEETEVKTNLTNMSSMHSMTSLNPKEYMTLAAMMNFGDEQITGKSTLRNRPEVALVTSDVDLNFTVNHALPKKRTFSNASERTLEEIELPRGTTVELPTKMKQEDDVLY
ncbi:hypothetical protein LOTGIDRAFT_163414 [Lottia gigantea]|uniref:C-type lectin domain-containing protein n=1 Tax=Lottia gigantea TaxID=225164 RepID=V4A9C5_LOTGI|nr:hypothetical protein LOTGIDRAFT_163414 [Lottia gigantea]ESO91685.1 hypothetical protein LOTGIDRAFT_163414 [Lottia gigantea]